MRIFEQKGREKENREIEKIVETELTKELSSGAQRAIAKRTMSIFLVMNSRTRSITILQKPMTRGDPIR